jgi:hypothetical protein
MNITGHVAEYFNYYINNYYNIFYIIKFYRNIMKTYLFSDSQYVLNYLLSILLQA